MFELNVSRHLRENTLSDEDLKAQIAARGDFWFHRFDFSNGVSTPGRDASAEKLHSLALPERLDGLSVIDIGAAEGYFAFQAEARGASSVVAADQFLWTWPGSNTLGNFRFVKDLLHSNVEERLIPVEDLSPSTVGTFDIALFLGVLYHAPNMVHYLERLRSVTKGMAVIETLVDLLDVDQPAAAFYPANTVNHDSSNWWGPNIACVESMLERVGFRRTTFVTLWECNSLGRYREEPAGGRLRSGRAIWHAFV